MQGDYDSIAIYSRKSKFTGKGESVGNQIELCKAYIRAQYGEAQLERVRIYEDEGYSGGNLKRPGFQKMMQDARARRLKALVVYRLDRISRNIGDFASLIETLHSLNVDFVSIREQFDTNSPMGRAMMYIASVFSQLERETIAERIRDNMHELAKTGRWLGGVPPTGYVSESLYFVDPDGKSRKSCRLKLIPEEADTIVQIYNLFIETESLTATEAELMKRAVRTKRGNYYSRFAIKSILQNPVYAIADTQTLEYFRNRNADTFVAQESFDGMRGILAYNRTDQKKGKRTEYRPIQEWIVTVGQHQGLIPGRVWVAVQSILERNKSKVYRKPRRNQALLTGSLYCSCGSRMYPKLHQSRNAQGQQSFSYVCKMKERSRGGVCNCSNINGNIIDQMVMEHIGALEEDRHYFSERLKQDRGFINCSTNQDDGLMALRQELNLIENKIESLIDSLAEFGDETTREYISNRISQLNQERMTMVERIQQLEEACMRQTLSDAQMEKIILALREWRRCIRLADTEQQRALLRTLVKCVGWDGERASISLTGSEQIIGENIAAGRSRENSK